MCKFLLLFRRWGATRKVAFFFSYSCRCLLSFRLVFSPETFFQIFNLMAQTWIDGKKFAAFVIRKKILHSLVPLQFRLKIFPVGGVKTGLESVDDETLFGVWCGSLDADGVELYKALITQDFSSDDDGSTMTVADLLDAGVLVMIVDVVVIFDDVTEDRVEWSIYRLIRKFMQRFRSRRKCFELKFWS